MAIVFFAIMTFIGSVSAQAQVNLLDPIHTPDTNPLLSTTGPNTVGKGHLQLSGMASWYGLSWDREEYVNTTTDLYSSSTVNVHNTYRELGGGLTLRYGIGSRFELMAGLAGADTRYHYEFSTGVNSDTMPVLMPSLGLKMILYEGGYGWVPQVSAYWAYRHRLCRYGNGKWDTPIGGSANVLGLQFRNRLSGRWMLDYGLSYSFSDARSLGVNSNTVYALQRDNPFQFNLMARWLATDRLMVSAGMENVGGVAEVMWQATPAVQLKAQAGFAAGLGFRTGIMEANAQVGVNWMIR